MNTPLKLLLIGAVLLSALPVFAVSNPSDALNQVRPERGWFFYEDPAKDTAQPAPPQPRPKPTDNKKQPDKCAAKETWVPDCGFVDPGTDFDFQAKQRDALMERMSLSHNDPKAVEDFQRYMHWAIGRATEVANLWYYNTVQHPDLDPTVSNPISQFGIRLMADVKSNQQNEIFKALKDEGASLVFFTRSDCTFCATMAPLVRSMATDTGLETWNASLDDRCEPQFVDKCRTGKAVTEPARRLGVTTVPTIFLALPDNTWIRIGTGVTDTSTLTTRVVTFFSAYRNALLKGLDNKKDGQAPMDFSGIDATGTAAGVRQPTEQDIRRMLSSTR
jgi:conjugal transfer pilus assembly protein TraF